MKVVNASLFLFVKIILLALSFKSSIFFKIFSHVQLFVISILFYLCYAILIMYLFILNILICSNSCFEFMKPRISPCNAVNSGCILKFRDFEFVFCLQIHALAGNTMNSKLFIMYSASLRALIQIFRSLSGHPVRVFVNKALTSFSNLK